MLPQECKRKGLPVACTMSVMRRYCGTTYLITSGAGSSVDVLKPRSSPKRSTQ